MSAGCTLSLCFRGKGLYQPDAALESPGCEGLTDPGVWSVQRSPCKEWSLLRKESQAWGDTDADGFREPFLMLTLYGR